jgi:replicative DNA helicase
MTEYATEDAYALPQDPFAEASVLGAMMLSADACAEALTLLRPQDFYLPLHEQLFSIMETLFTLGHPVDPITISAAATRQGLSDQLHNGAYLSRLLATPTTSANVSYYAHIVQDKALLRRLADVTLKGYHSAMNPAAGSKDTAARVVNDIVHAATEHIVDDSVTAYEAVQEALSWVEARNDQSRIPLLTGYPDLDEDLSEISAGQLILIAARPSAGKSVALLDIARNVTITQHRPAILFSLEMSTQEIGLRLLSALSGVRISHIKEGKLTEANLEAMSVAAEQINAAPLTIETNPHMTVADIRARAVRHQRKHGLDLILVDYLGLITPSSTRRDHYVEVGEIARGLKILAKDVAPVVAAAQLNRNPEHRPDKRPALADLRDSGSLEQDSDVVLLLHREDMYDPNTPRAGEVEIILAKNRNGPTGSVTLAAQLDKARFASMYSAGIPSIA